MTGPVPTMRLIGGALTMLVLVAACGAAFAGRPLTVDDANTNEKGAGHVEAWVARAHGATVVNVAPAFAPLDRLELAATLSRDTTNQVTASAVQAKVILTERQDKGCNLGASGGFAHVGSGGGNGSGRGSDASSACASADTSTTETRPRNASSGIGGGSRRGEGDIVGLRSRRRWGPWVARDTSATRVGGRARRPVCDSSAGADHRTTALLKASAWVAVDVSRKR